jgi:hypothetical protein
MQNMSLIKNLLTFIFRNNFSENTEIKLDFDMCFSSRNEMNHDAFI